MTLVSLLRPCRLLALMSSAPATLMKTRSVMLFEILEKASASGPDTVAFVYFAGIGLQLEGDNFLVPVDGNITRDTDVALEAIRVTDYTRSLAALRLKATIVVLDAARANPFSVPLAGGLALVEADPGADRIQRCAGYHRARTAKRSRAVG